LQSEKQPSPKTSVDAGRLLLTKPVLINALFSTRDNLDLDVIVTEESDLHL
jgi:hypothetical protein